MKQLKIQKVLKYNTYLLENENEKFELTLEFYGVLKPKEGDVFKVHEKLLDKNSIKFTQPYAFELTDISQEMIEELNEEYAVLYSENKVYTLKRIYG